MHQLAKYSTEIGIAGIAALGGVAKHLHAYLSGTVQFNIWRMLSRAVVSLFSGYTAAQVVTHVVGEPDMAMAVAGLWGYLGAEGIDWLIAIAQKKVK